MNSSTALPEKAPAPAGKGHIQEQMHECWDLEAEPALGFPSKSGLMWYRLCVGT